VAGGDWPSARFLHNSVLLRHVPDGFGNLDNTRVLLVGGETPPHGDTGGG
jgi:hypothetical protein